MTAKPVHDLFVLSLSDIYSAAKQMTKALPKLAGAATNFELSGAFTTHLEETRGQTERIDQVVEATWRNACGDTSAKTLNEEKATDAKLSLLAEEEIAAEALCK